MTTELELDCITRVFANPEHMAFFMLGSRGNGMSAAGYPAFTRARTEAVQFTRRLDIVSLKWKLLELEAKDKIEVM